MTWMPTAYIDEMLRGWMKANGWEVNSTDYDFERKVYSWRHKVRSGPSPTLRISQGVLEDYPAFEVLYHLDRLRVSAAIRKNPAAPLVVVQRGSKVLLEEALGD
jgi:hypothetical protein